MRDLKRIPNPQDVPPGSVLLWTDESDRRRLRIAMAGLTLGAAAAGAGVGYAVGRARGRKANVSKKRQTNPTPLQWTALVAGGATALGLTFVALRRMTEPSERSNHRPVPGAPTPTEPPGTTLPPQTPVDECSPLDPATWGTGNLCIYDKPQQRWVRYAVPPEGPQGEQYVYKCTAEIVDDHLPFIGERHGELSSNAAYQIETALALKKESVDGARLSLGLHPMDVITRHDHPISLSSSELDALAAGETVEVMTGNAVKAAESWGDAEPHTHHVRLRCTRVRV